MAEWKSDPNAQDVAFRCREFFADLGVPTTLRSDNGPQFAAASFQKFLQRWGVKWSPSTPHYPQSNWSEVYVKKCKHMLAKLTKPDTTSEEFHEAMLELRNTPNADGRSPNMIVYGRNLHSRLTVHHSAFDPIWTKIADAADKKKAELSEKATDHYNSTARDHKPFRVGQHVRVQDTTSKRWDKVGEIVGINMHHDYRVKMSSGRTWWRNRHYLRLYHPEIEDSLAATPNDDDAPTQDLDQEVRRRRHSYSTSAKKHAKENEDSAVQHGLMFIMHLHFNNSV